MDQTQPPPFPGHPSGQPGSPCPYHCAPPPPPPPHQRPGTGILHSCLAAGCVTVFVPILLVLGFFVLVFFLLGSGAMDANTRVLDEFAQAVSAPSVYARILKPGDAANSIALVTIHGGINGDGSPLEADGMLAFASDQLKAAREDGSVRAVILQIDSPGGGLTASDQIHHEVELLRESGKPVLAWAGALMASGGYYIAAAADGIMANPTSTVGSIGVIMQHFQMRELIGKIGVKVDPVTSGAHKDIGSPFREMTPGEREVLQKYVDASYARFVDIVARGRNLDPEKVRAMATGDIYDAETAKRLGLVDDIGYIEDAVAWAEEKTGAKGMRVIAYSRILSFMDFFS
ncbi:MAG: signal peptide peptidase SppA, partial [Planctomycetota bacterium]|nr:signal peptide peptidase SppA [Planctomycetota bacterium]